LTYEKNQSENYIGSISKKLEPKLNNKNEENSFIKQLQVKIPQMDLKIKHFNRILLSLVDKGRAERKPPKHSKMNILEEVHNISLFGETFEFPSQRRRSRFCHEKTITPKANIIFHYPVQFELLRLFNGIYLQDYIESISNSCNWNNSGGKTGANFIKTHDQRFVFKQLEKKEFSMLLSFVQEYFQYTFKAYKANDPILLSKIYGIYEIQHENKSPLYYIAMENLFYGIENHTKVYDLKGSELGRYSGSQDKHHTFLDTDFKIQRNGEPIPLTADSFAFIEKAIMNDTKFLAGLEIVDYSLLLILDENKSTFRMGIIDYLRMYDLEKQLEHVGKKFIKGATPTIVSPDNYSERFQKAMKKYFMPIH